MSKIIGILFAFTLILTAYEVVLAASSQAPDSIKIGCTLGLTGRFAGNAIEVKDGYEIGVQHINQAGGIFIKEFGKKIPIRLVLYDDESDPPKAAARYEKLFVEDKVTAYLGSFSTVVNTSLIAVAEKTRCPSSCPISPILHRISRVINISFHLFTKRRQITQRYWMP